MVKQNSYILDFVIRSRPLTKKQEKELKEYIAKRKLEIKKQNKGARKSHAAKDIVDAFNEIKLHEKGKKKLKSANQLLDEI